MGCLTASKSGRDFPNEIYVKFFILNSVGRILKISASKNVDI